MNGIVGNVASAIIPELIPSTPAILIKGTRREQGLAKDPN